MSGMCKFNFMFIIEVIVKAIGLPFYIHERRRILQKPLNIKQSRTKPPLTMTSVLKHIIIFIYI